MESLLDAIARAAHGATESVVRGAELADLVSLFDPEVMLVTGPTAPTAEALLHARALADAGPRSTKVEVSSPDGVPDAAAFDVFAIRDAPHADAWSAFVEEVTTVFAYLMGAELVGVRQVIADAPHCPRFHVDRVPARGVLNVLGPCTEWLDEADVDRSRLGHAGGDDDQVSGLVRRWDRLQRADPLALAVFKGSAWPGAERRAVVHRSPPPDGERRVLLTLDWLG